MQSNAMRARSRAAPRASPLSCAAMIGTVSSLGYRFSQTIQANAGLRGAWCRANTQLDDETRRGVQWFCFGDADFAFFLMMLWQLSIAAPTGCLLIMCIEVSFKVNKSRTSGRVCINRDFPK